jgi:hypothetical protein
LELNRLIYAALFDIDDQRAVFLHRSVPFFSLYILCFSQGLIGLAGEICSTIVPGKIGVAS